MIGRPRRRLIDLAAAALTAAALTQPTSPPPPAADLLARPPRPPASADEADIVIAGQHTAAELNLPTEYSSAVAALQQRRCRGHLRAALPAWRYLAAGTFRRGSLESCPNSLQ